MPENPPVPGLRWELPRHSVSEFSPKGCRYCLLIVVYNEGERIRRQIERTKPFQDYVDVIIADGESTDGSLIEDELRENGVRALLRTPERGLCTATRLALAYGLAEGYEGLITVDGNGKDGMEAIPSFVSKLKEDFDLIQGSRFLPGGKHDNTPIGRYVAVRMIAAPIISLGSWFLYTDPTNAFRAMSRDYLLDPRVQPIRSEFVRFNLQHYLNYRAASLGLACCEIPVIRVYPDNGEVPTKLNFPAMLLVFWELLLTVVGHYNLRGTDDKEAG